MKLEFKYLAPYLPYGLKCKYVDEDKLYTLDAVITETNQDKKLLQLFHVLEKNSASSCKIILHPLSDLTKEIEVDGEKFIPLVKLTELSSIVSPCDFNGLYIKTYDNDPDYIECYENTGSPDDHLCIAIHIPDILKCEYWMINKLFEWHFDVFGLIKEGLAIDKNTLQS